MPLILNPCFSGTSLCLMSALMKSSLVFPVPHICVCQEWSVVCGSSQALGLKPVHFSCIWLHLNCGPVHHHNFSLPFDWISDIIQGTNLISSNILFVLFSGRWVSLAQSGGRGTQLLFDSACGYSSPLLAHIYYLCLWPLSECSNMQSVAFRMSLKLSSGRPAVLSYFG